MFMSTNKLDLETCVAGVFHAVRKIPYFSGSDRSIMSVVKNNRGSCSGKHILLRDILRRQSHNATIETIRGDFTSRIPALGCMSDELRRLCEIGNIVDFHQYVIWESRNGEVRLDATWSDGPVARGIPGNQQWLGVGDTSLALTPDAVLQRVEDIAVYKKKLLAALDTKTRQRRRRFLSLLTDWAEKTETERV